MADLNWTVLAVFALAQIALASHCAAQSDDTVALLDQRYDDAQKRYDPATASQLHRDVAKIATDTPNASTALTLLYAKTCLLTAELYRMEYEELDDGKSAERRALGNQVDHIANAGLDALASVTETSEVWRLRADLIGTRIRTRFQARKLRRTMEAAIDRAIQLDPENAAAHVTAAKPFLFGKDTDSNITVAMEHLDKALTLEPDHEQAQMLRGFAFEELGDLESAQACWTDVLARNPDARPAKAGLQRLRRNHGRKD